MNNLKVSVHDIVDLLLRSGHIDQRIFNSGSMQEGTRLHGIYQSKQDERYISEYAMQGSYLYDDYIFDIFGRADGVITNEDGVTIDEIKTMVGDMQSFYDNHHKWHEGQAKMYAYMYALKNNLLSISIRLTYISQKTNEIKQYSSTFEIKELESFFYDLLAKYVELMKKVDYHLKRRKETLSNITFPYGDVRDHQGEMIDIGVKTLEAHCKAFVEAPTGIGKTIGALYPFVEAMQNEEIKKLFYLTSKNSIKHVAQNTIQDLYNNGAFISSITLTSKEIICPNINGKRHCNPDECIFARNYYDKIGNIIMSIADKSINFDRISIEEMSHEYMVCPFELELDISKFVDIIICDYNYVFDPLMKLQRYFDVVSDKYLLLVDEAHNLISRARDMYSSSISLKTCKFLNRDPNLLGQKKIRIDLDNIINYLVNSSEKIVSDDGYLNFPDGIEQSIITILESFKESFKALQKDETIKISDALLDFYFVINKFLQLPLVAKEGYSFYLKNAEGDINLNIYCLNPKNELKSIADTFLAVEYFSATLSPLPYYVDLLGGEETDFAVSLPSPFPQENLLMLVNPTISTFYRNRDNSIYEIYENIKNATSGRIGNYMIFFSSYDYLDKVYRLFVENEQINIIVQEKDMDEEARKSFLDNFILEPWQTTLGFCVLGGIFGEGIDLASTRLIGAIIVGVGLPAISYTNNLLKQYFDDKELNGFNYAYTFPGLNKVMQAVGRVIRSSTDKGVVLLLGERYNYPLYKSLFKKEWSHYKIIKTSKEIKEHVKTFWEGK